MSQGSEYSRARRTAETADPRGNSTPHEIEPSAHSPCGRKRGPEGTAEGPTRSVGVRTRSDVENLERLHRAKTSEDEPPWNRTENPQNESLSSYRFGNPDQLRLFASDRRNPPHCQSFAGASKGLKSGKRSAENPSNGRLTYPVSR